MGILQGKVAIITGAGQGIGRGIALAFIKEGACVTVADINPQTAANTAAEIRELGGKALAIGCDVGNREQVQKMVAQTVSEFGTVDILINNAQASENHRPIEEITDEDVRSTLGSGLLGTLYCSQACFPFLKKKGGKVINMASASGIIGMANDGIYAATKEAIRGLSRTMATDWAKYRINVNVICPSAPTAMAKQWAMTVGPEEVQKLRSRMRLQKDCDCERDIGRTAVFLAGPDSDFITAQSLMVDGGFITT